MSTPEPSRADTAPFLVKLFYRTGAFHRPDEFISPSSLPPHLHIHTWKDCSLTELSHHMLGAAPPILPDPAVGTRLAFRLIYADTRVGSRMDLPPRYVAKELGSVVLSGGVPGAGVAASRSPRAIRGEDNDEEEADDDDEKDREPWDDGAKTLADARFVAGDYISCAILPPDELTGEVAPASSARMGRGAGVGEARGSMGAGPPPPVPRHRDRDYLGPPPGGFRGRGAFRGGGGGGGGSGRGYGGGGRYRDRDEPSVRIPEGDWRRGDRLPDDPPEPGRWRR